MFAASKAKGTFSTIYLTVCHSFRYPLRVLSIGLNNRSPFFLRGFNTQSESYEDSIQQRTTGLAKQGTPIQQIDLKGLSITHVCDLLDSRKLTPQQITDIAISFVYRDSATKESVECAVRALYRINCHKEISEFFSRVKEYHQNVMFNPRTIEMIFESIIREKQFELLDILWLSCSIQDQKKWGILSSYSRGLLASRRISDARSFLTKMEREGYTIPVANCNTLQGLYEGGYYEECCKFFEGLLPIDSSFQILGDQQGVVSALYSAYESKRYSLALTAYSVLKIKNVTLSWEVICILSIIFDKGDFWKDEFDKRLLEYETQHKQINDKQKIALLAQCRLPQLLGGFEVVNQIASVAINPKLAKDRYQNYHVNLVRMTDSQRRLKLIEVLNEVGEYEKEKEVGNRKVVVSTIKEDEEIMRLLRSEVFPTISFEVVYPGLNIPISSIVKWKQSRLNPII